MTGNVADLVGRVLGPPKRYAYSSQPVTVYVREGSTFRRKDGYSVDFEIACDTADLTSARGKDCMYNPHLVNIVEPGLDGTERNSIISHSIFLDNEAYSRLMKVSNTRGKLHKYNGVVEGYAVRDIEKAFNVEGLTDTGVCLSDAVIESNCVRCPDIPFDENKHMRYVQASESYINKVRKSTMNKMALSNIYQPIVLGFNVDNKLQAISPCE